MTLKMYSDEIDFWIDFFDRIVNEQVPIQCWFVLDEADWLDSQKMVSAIKRVQDHRNNGQRDTIKFRLADKNVHNIIVEGDL